MSNLIYYERHLPRRLPPGETSFITFRLAGSLPQETLVRLQAEARLLQQQCSADVGAQYAERKRYVGRFDALLAGSAYGPDWLRKPAVAAVVQQGIQYPAGQGYNLRCYCIMPNHVHLVAALPDVAPSLAKILQLLKGYSSFQANKLLGLNGACWQAESYDHVIRPGEVARYPGHAPGDLDTVSAFALDRIIGYVLENPVKAGLVNDWQRWPYRYLAPS